MIRPSSTFAEEMSRFEAEIGNTTAAQLASNTSSAYQQVAAAAPPSVQQPVAPQKYLGTTLPGNIFPARPPMIPPTLLSTNKPNPFANSSSSSNRGSFPPPPPAVLLNNLQSNSAYTMGSPFQAASSTINNFSANKSHFSMSSAPTIYAAPSTNKPKDEDEDILAILQKTEKEVKKEAKEMKKQNFSSTSMSFKPSSVSASELGKKAKLMAESVNSTSTTTIKTVQVPQSTKDRMLALKNNKIDG